MEEHQVVPDLISQTPPEVLKVTYGELKVNMGNELTPTQVKDIPTVEWDANDDTYYTLCLTDPDAPSRKDQSWREWHHWLVANIPGNDIDMGYTLSEYVGSAPPPETGLHRYVFLLYAQPDKLTFDEPQLTNTSAEKREKFSINNFAAKYNLGNPIAGNFYQAEFDSHCLKIYEQLGVKL